jgi:hypothetical protein
MDEGPDWFLVNQIVTKAYQYQEVIDPPLESIRMAWPFKTEAERLVIKKWFKDVSKRACAAKIADMERAWL